MADRLGAEGIIATGKTFTNHFVAAVNKMAVDPSAKVSSLRLVILEELMLDNNVELCRNIVHDKDQCYLEKFLIKIRAA
ncbi:uncharacterized protein LOC117824239 [Xyrichtys novacula]|uniref:Uncharacterized protein LOC117824239 n=1 Tax=Xyrichtys novacula TaxID=13765 RepID=A0AAV1GXX0_XYRNO|nr:uncharacterized protein LOC117824239 [Xyrichtys novacula]